MKIAAAGTAILLIFVLYLLYNFDIIKEQELKNGGAGESAPPVMSSDELIEKRPEETDFADEAVYQMLKETYADFDFTSEFKKGNMDEYGYYIRQFNRLLKGEDAFWDKETQKEYYIDEYGQFKIDVSIGIFDLGRYFYYFFDMDGDGAPELCISDRARCIYIFKYDTHADEFVLWYPTEITWNYLVGSGKMGYGQGTYHSLLNIDQNGEEESSICFFSDGYDRSVTPMTRPAR